MAVRKSALIIAKFVLLHCAFYKLKRNFGFFCSVSHPSGPLRKHMFTCDWSFWSTLFVSVFQGSIVACDCPLSGNNRPVFFKDFSDVLFLQVSCKNKAMSASCLLQNVHSSSRFPSLFLSSLESFSVLFLWAKLGKSWFALTPPPLKWLMEQKKPFEVCKRAPRYNEFGHKNSGSRKKV